ncbi:hypothetical protein C2S51_023680 [Perilla frutescens var. frutescens]|nr:hypothetical protein C2S51_023680 [Perilla frutescens var. frutescens]
MAKSKVSMKLLIDSTKGKGVLFAEAGKDCVDFLFHILSLPVATVIRLLQAQGMEGLLPNLYQSLQDLSNTYILPDKNKGTFLNPVLPVSSSSVPLLGLNVAREIPNTKPHKCDSCSARFSDDELCRPGFYSCESPSYGSSRNRNRNSSCPSCDGNVTKNVPAEDGVGLVKEVVTYMVMDDLVVKPMSTISSITLLNKFNVKDVGALEEKVVNLGMNEAVKLLKASLQSKNVLTDVFCS